jgi:hypothetical protein
MINRNTVFLALVVMGALTVLGEAGEKEKSGKAKSELSQRRALKAKRKLRQRRAQILKDVEAIKNLTFEKVNTKLDILRGYVSYSVPSTARRNYVAYVCLRWGDLDEKTPVRKDYYENWDGYVKVQRGGYARVAKEFKFDDGTPGRDPHKGRGQTPAPGPGSGRDRLLKDKISSMISWESGIVGDTDGLLIEIHLQKANAKGTIKAGKFTIPFTIVPKPEKK